MLQKYVEEQKVVCDLLINSINTDRYSHAYLFVVNNYNKAYEFIYSFVKSICCCKIQNCKDCNVCKLIDTNSFSDFKVIDTDSLVLKKEVIVELQDYFETKSLYSKKRVYLIKNCEKMNTAASNTLLKFLEEPEDDIIAILTTDNVNQVMDTIKSRCQIINFSSNSDYQLSSLYNQLSINLDESTYENFLDDIDNIFKFSLFVEKNGISTIAFTKKKWHDFFSDRNRVKYAFDIMLYMYIDVINIKVGRKVTYFIDYIDNIEELSKYHDLQFYIKKIKVIVKYIDLIKYNLNLNLLIDKVIMEWEGDFCE